GREGYNIGPGCESRTVGGRGEVEVETGREVVLGGTRRQVAFPIAPWVRLRVQPAVSELLFIRRLLAGPRVPHDHLARLAPLSAPNSDDPCAVRAEGCAHDEARVPFQFEQFCPGPGVPQLHRQVAAAGDDARTVWAERHAIDVPRVPLQFERL